MEYRRPVCSLRGSHQVFRPLESPLDQRPMQIFTSWAPLRRVLCMLFTALLWAPLGSAQMKDFSNRTEGSWSPHANADITLVGLTRSPILFTPNSTLKVQFYVPGGPDGGTPKYSDAITIESREIIPVRNYFMRSKPMPWNLGAWNEFGPWPTKTCSTRLVFKLPT